MVQYQRFVNESIPRLLATVACMDGFMISLATPIVKTKIQKEIRSFYTMTEYNEWKEKTENVKKWNIKYYKV